MLNSREIKLFLSDHFDLIGICPAVTPQGLSHFHQWLESGYAGEMDYLPDRRDAYAHPQHVLDGAKSIIMLGSKYALLPERSFEPDAETANREQNDPFHGGKIARYARGSHDYHDLIHKKLKQSIRHLLSLHPKARFRGVVDTAPLLEREFAQLAGIGWQGKNTMLISKTDGSWFFLSAILTDMVLEYDSPFEADHCGTCTACLDACPTDAFVKERVLDARRCLSYWNIESQNLADEEVRNAMGDWIFGCDICQEVCPWNRRSTAYVDVQIAANNEFAGELEGFSVERMIEILEMDDDDFRQDFRRTPFWRSKRRGMMRNILVVLGNLQEAKTEPHIVKALNDPDSMVRCAAAWALSRFNGEQSHLALQSALEKETDPAVIEQIKHSLGKIT